MGAAPAVLPRRWACDYTAPAAAARPFKAITKEPAMLLRKLIAFAITSGLAKKAWDHYRDPRRRQPANPVDITEVVARPVSSADPMERRNGLRRMGARRRREGPSA